GGWGRLPADCRERIARAAAAGGGLRQDTAPDEIVDIAKGGVLGSFDKFRPFGRRELAFETIQQAIDDAPLPVTEICARISLPEARLAQHGRQYRLRTIERAVKTTEKPGEPVRNIEIAFLRLLQDVVIVAALFSDLRGHAVEALRAVFRARERLIGDGPGDP